MQVFEEAVVGIKREFSCSRRQLYTVSVPRTGRIIRTTRLTFFVVLEDSHMEPETFQSTNSGPKFLLKHFELRMSTLDEDFLEVVGIFE